MADDAGCLGRDARPRPGVRLGAGAGNHSPEANFADIHLIGDPATGQGIESP